MYFFGLEVYNFWWDGYLEAQLVHWKEDAFFKIRFDFFFEPDVGAPSY